MTQVIFLDTSILTNLFDIPHKNSQRDEVVREFERLRAANATLVLPMAALLETGNHIAQLGGTECRRCMKTFVAALLAALQANPPWSISGIGWEPPLLRQLVEGEGARPSLLNFAAQGIGFGDASILTEMAAYRSRVPSGTPIALWTYDSRLSAHS